DERWAYVLETVRDQDAVGPEAGQGWVQTVSIDEIASPADPDPETLLGTREKVSGQVIYQQLAVKSGLLYVAAEDKATSAQPERGLVAVLDVEEAACDAIFTKTLDGCPTCPEEGDKAGRCVVLAHIPKYHSGKGFHDPGKSPDGESEIDNLTYRSMLPSTQNITEVIRCMLEQGIAEGIPGPRGAAGPRGPAIQEVVLAETQPAPGSDPTVALEAIPDDEEGDLRLVLGIPAGIDGEDGERGPGITAVTITTLEPGSDATASLFHLPFPSRDFALRLGIPAGKDGEDGIRGPGIVDVDVTTLAPGSGATASLETITADPEGDQILHLGIPRGEPGEPGGDERVPRIVALSWKHDAIIPPGAFQNFLVDPNITDPDPRTEHLGLVIMFDSEIDMRTILQESDPGNPEAPTRSEVFQLYARLFDDATGLLCECLIPGATHMPVEVLNMDGDDLITEIEPRPGAEVAKAVRLVFAEKNFPGVFDRERLFVRVVLRADFVLDVEEGKGVDGNFIGGKLPTGNARQGNTFESWLRMGDPNDI
ncbi:MAG: hypothetical protein JXA33_00740, partial [Anaerolineae bacterium]|nr:hypothetical protein [Anaerolineae bacterium]